MKKSAIIAIIMCLEGLGVGTAHAERDTCQVVGNSPSAVMVSGHASVVAGYLMRDGKVDAKLPDGSAAYPLARPVLGAKVAVDLRPLRRVQGLADWNDATVGVALDYLNLGNNQWLGSVVAPYTYMRVPVVRLPHFELGIRPGIGLAFATKTYGNTIPEADKYAYLYQKDGVTMANQCAGSVTNFYFAEALYVEVPIRKGFSLVASGGWYHVSNGSTIQPNSGYNVLNAELGLRYTPEESQEAEQRLTQGRIGPKRMGLYDGKRWDVEASASGWFRQVYYKDRMTFGVATASVSAHYRPWAIFRIGGGVDVFYDGAYRPHETLFGKTAMELATAADCWRVGVSVQPEFVVGHFTAGFHFGAYVLDGVKELEASTQEEKAQLEAGQRLKKPMFYRYDLLQAGSAGHPDGWLYTRIVLKYRPTEHFFIQMGMKAHLTKAEFIDLGAGVSF